MTEQNLSTEKTDKSKISNGNKLVELQKEEKEKKQNATIGELCNLNLQNQQLQNIFEKHIEREQQNTQKYETIMKEKEDEMKRHLEEEKTKLEKEKNELKQEITNLRQNMEKMQTQEKEKVEKENQNIKNGEGTSQTNDLYQRQLETCLKDKDALKEENVNFKQEKENLQKNIDKLEKEIQHKDYSTNVVMFVLYGICILFILFICTILIAYIRTKCCKNKKSKQNKQHCSCNDHHKINIKKKPKLSRNLFKQGEPSEETANDYTKTFLSRFL
jgi:DNA repair exonuclease SbcCD ATPase subunit